MSANRILLTGNARHEEAVAAGAIKPGHLIAFDSTGKVAVHAVAGGRCERMFAEEDALQGRGISDAYAADERVMCAVGYLGTDLKAFLSAGETVTPASLLTSNGDGTLKVATGSDEVIARSKETLDNTDSDAVDVLISVRLI